MFLVEMLIFCLDIFFASLIFFYFEVTCEGPSLLICKLRQYFLKTFQFVIQLIFLRNGHAEIWMAQACLILNIFACNVDGFLYW